MTVDDPELLRLLWAATHRDNLELVITWQVEFEVTTDEGDVVSRKIFSCSEEEEALEFARLGFLDWLEQDEPSIALKECQEVREPLGMDGSASNLAPDVADVSELRRYICRWAAMFAYTVHMNDEKIVGPETTKLFRLEPGDWPYLAEALVFGDWRTHPDPMARVTQLAKNIKYKHERDGTLNSKGRVDVQQARSIEPMYPTSEKLGDNTLERAFMRCAREQVERLDDVDLENLCRDLKLNAKEKELLVARSLDKIKKRDAETPWRTQTRKIAQARATGRLARTIQRNSKSRVVAAEPISDASLTVFLERVGGRSIWRHKGLDLD